MHYTRKIIAPEGVGTKYVPLLRRQLHLGIILLQRHLLVYYKVCKNRYHHYKYQNNKTNHSCFVPHKAVKHFSGSSGLL